MHLYREHYVIMSFLAIYIPFIVLLNDINYSPHYKSTAAWTARLLIYVIMTTGSLLWVVFALALQPCVIKSRVLPQLGIK